MHFQRWWLGSLYFGWDSNPHCTHFECVASCRLGYRSLCPDTCSLHVAFSSSSPGHWCGDTSSRHAGVWCGVTLDIFAGLFGLLSQRFQ